MKKTAPREWSSNVAFLFLACLGFGSVPSFAWAENHATAPTAELSTEEGSGAPGEASSRVYIDSATGELITKRQPGGAPPPRVTKARSLALSRSTDGLRPFELAAGGRGIFLAGRFQSATVVRRQADGSLEIRCGTVHAHSSPASRDDGHQPASAGSVEEEE